MIYILNGLKLFQSLEMVLCLAYYIAVVMRWEFKDMKDIELSLFTCTNKIEVKESCIDFNESMLS